MQKNVAAISPAVIQGLMAWDWPGNIRELENFIERAMIITRGKSLEAPIQELQRTDSRNDKTRVADEYERGQRDEIIRALMACKGRVAGAYGAAERLRMRRSTFISRMNRFGIYAKQYARSVG